MTTDVLSWHVYQITTETTEIHVRPDLAKLKLLKSITDNTPPTAYFHYMRV